MTALPETIPSVLPDRRRDPDEELRRVFQFDLAGYKLKDPQTDEGFVTSIEQKDPVSMAGNQLPDGVDVFDVYVADPFVEADPEAYALLSDYTDGMESELLKRGYDPYAEKRHEARKPSDYNEFTRAWTLDEKVKGVRVWRSLVPTALALHYLSHPWVGSVIENPRRKHESTIITPESAIQKRMHDDSVAIRDRAVAMQEVVGRHLMQSSVDRSGQPIKWLSLASGTAEPVIRAAAGIEKRLGIPSNLMV